LAILRSLAAGVAPKGPPASCAAVARRLVAELQAPRRARAVVGVTRTFDPPISQALALAVVRRMLRAGDLTVAYSLIAADCAETIYESRALRRTVGSGGVLVELTSGRGIADHYDRDLVDRARLSYGRGALGGQACV
jgi:hypothetical protein